MFHDPPCQLERAEFLVRNCCCVPEERVASKTESAMKPPLDHPPSDSVIDPFTCMRRKLVACDTAHTFTFESWVGVTAIFSTERQKFWVAFPPNQPAFERTAPVIFTSSGDLPRPRACI